MASESANDTNVRTLGEQPAANADPFRIASFVLSENVEFVALRAFDMGHGYGTLVERGSICGGVDESITAACRQQIANLEATLPVKSPRDFVYALTIHAGKPKLWRGAAQLRRLLGPIDTAAEARFWLYATSKVPPACGLDLLACETKVKDGYELRSVVEFRCGPNTQTTFVHHVTTDGVVHLLKRNDQKRLGPCKIQ